jgi:hypothetical protein
MTTDVLKRVATLPDKSIQELKQLWQELYQNDAPPYNRTFMIKRLAFRIQELAFGGISEATDTRLKILSGELEKGATNLVASIGKPVVGTQLIREWRGVEHSCIVLENGFEYQGQRYKSLSAVARAITGTRWNGLIFWGLKKAGGTK